MSVYASSHPLVKHKVSLLRDDKISVKSFRELTKELAVLLTMEATTQLSLENKPLTCWSGIISAPMLSEKQPTLVPILRAGLGMLDGALSILPCAKVSVVGLKRDEQTLQPISYYQNIVNDVSERQAIIIDPMLATGSSMVLAYRALLSKGKPKHCHIVSLIASSEGIEYTKKHLPENCTIWVGAIDQEMTAQSYIVPGLGDAGDLAFGTKE